MSGTGKPTRDEIKLTVLPLNGGHSVFVDAPGRKNDWLVDCGNDSAVEFTLKPFLRAQGVNRIQRLVLTHGDLKDCRRRGTARPTFRRRRTVDQSRASFARRLIAMPLPDLKSRRPGTKFSIAAMPPAAGGCCIRPPEIISRARTTTRWCCSEIFPAHEFCCCPIWGATVKAPCSRAPTICARTS